MKTVILTGLQGTGKSKIAKLFGKESDVQFIEIQERSGNNTNYQFGRILLVNLDLVDYDVAVIMVRSFIKKQIHCVGDVVRFRRPFNENKQEHVCICDCEGDLVDVIDYNFKLIKE